MTAVVSIEIGGMSAEYVRAPQPLPPTRREPSMNRDAETVPARHEAPDVAELRRLAEAATPGPWDYYRPHPNYRAYAVDRVMPGGHLGEDVATTGDVYAEENGAYIAAANPAVVLALLDERDALAAKVERVRAMGDHWLRLSGSSMTDEVREWTLAAGLSIRHAIDGSES